MIPLTPLAPSGSSATPRAAKCIRSSENKIAYIPSRSLEVKKTLIRCAELEIASGRLIAVFPGLDKYPIFASRLHRKAVTIAGS
ncbi:hypothetical protein XA68_12398 [Ophiocordyceps unilateralis]|uniref:Uncharacterized protein n=1 Tax=Ophiocordyceps unilateralis TaxID=268505 RepID=A0A2A9PEJ7_OPHUN|nr:hypothetical protein XA68_12398 [Ophiocordyceps unilateralis]